ncbi:MAG TPA: hypothetical protein VGF55_04960 [Gemmataceae bacterium]
MSIVRVGLSETQKFADGYDAIFHKKKGAAKPAPTKPAAKAAAKKKPTKKK